MVGILNEGVGIGIGAVKNDRHRHIYTWNFQNLQNLLNFAGFEVTGFEPNVSQALEHAKKINETKIFRSHIANLYIWVRGVKI